MIAAIIVLGLVLGVLVAIPPIGPVTVLVMHRVFEGDDRGALRVGLGRVVPEAVYAGLATFGVAALLREVPGVERGIEIIGVVVLAIVGVWLVLVRPKPIDPAVTGLAGRFGPPLSAEQRRRRWGDWSGFVIAAVNPTPLLSWSAFIGVTIATFELEPTLADKLAFPLALGAGIGLGYALLIATLKRWRGSAGERVVQQAVRVFGGVFVVVALAGAVRLLAG